MRKLQYNLQKKKTRPKKANFCWKPDNYGEKEKGRECAKLLCCLPQLVYFRSSHIYISFLPRSRSIATWNMAINGRFQSKILYFLQKRRRKTANITLKAKQPAYIVRTPNFKLNICIIIQFSLFWNRSLNAVLLWRAESYLQPHNNYYEFKNYRKQLVFFMSSYSSMKEPIVTLICKQGKIKNNTSVAA